MERDTQRREWVKPTVRDTHTNRSDTPHGTHDFLDNNGIGKRS